MRLEEIEKSLQESITNKEYCAFMDDVQYLLSEVKRLKIGIMQIYEYGHNNDCLKCAMKDTLVNKLLEDV
jgi:hypothetical protein